MQLSEVSLEGSNSAQEVNSNKIEIVAGENLFEYQGMGYTYSSVQGCFVNSLGECLAHNDQKITQIVKLGQNKNGRYIICEKENGKPLILPLQGEEGIIIDSIALTKKALPERTLGKIEGMDVYFRKGSGLFTMNHQEILIEGQRVKEVAYIYGEMMVVELMDDAFTYIHLTDNPKIQAIKGGSRNGVRDALSM